MDSDFSDKDEKPHVRSALDALGDSMTKGGKRRGRPRKYPKPSSSSASSSHRRSPSHEKAEPISDEGSSDGEHSSKRKRRGSDDEEWDEEMETLSLSQRREMRTRKRPALFSEESYSANSAKRRQTTGKRNHRGGPRQTYKSYVTPERPYPITYNKPAPLMEAKLTKEERDLQEKWRQQWRDIEHPLQAKNRLLPDLRRGMFEKCLEQIAPIPGSEPATTSIPESISSIFGQITCSAGFSEFLKNISLAACVAMYDICDKLFLLGEDMPDNMKIAQALRFWWNSLSFSTRRKWEQHARSAVYNDLNNARPMDERAAADANEVPIRNVTLKRLTDEEKWEDMHASSMRLLDEIDTVVSCPLCEKDENAEPCKLQSIKDMQEHFFHYHWQVHGYACHFCGTMFSTADELMAGHSDCDEWVAWNATRILTGSSTGKLTMTCCRMLICCSDCGWYKPLSRRDWNTNEEITMNYLKTFFSNHNNDGLLTMVVYFPGKPGHEVNAIRFAVTSMAGGDPQAPCVHCGDSIPFRDPETANEHYAKEHKDMALICEVCEARTTTEYLLKQHQMSHIHDNSSYFADYLSNTARIFPPPTNLSSAPRSGWKLRAKGDNIAVGGLIGGVSANSGFDLVEPNEDVSEAKARLIRKRKKEGKPTIDKGYENPDLEEESDMARKIREKLKSKYSDYEGMGAFDDPTWLRDSEAIKFREWMEYWESAEGRKKGGPPRDIEVDLSPSILRIPTVEVELMLKDMDILSGFLLNENVFYCCECDTIVKGEQASQHLKLKGTDWTSTKCAMNEGELVENPLLNENMFQLYSFAAAPADFRLPCPHCPVWSCSITGLRVHIMTVHGIFVKYQRVPNESVTNVVALKFDIRTRLGQKIDAKLGMLPSGMLAQRRPQVTDVNVLEKSWPSILLTRENCPPDVYQNLKQFMELERMQQQAQPRVILAPPRGGITQVQGYRPPFRPETSYNRTVPQPQVRYTSLEQSLQMQQQRMTPQNRLMGSATPMARTLNTVSRAMNHPPAPIGRGSQLKKLVAMSHKEGEKIYLTCQVCTSSAIYEQELLKAHLLRCHFHTCGHCTAIFVYEEEARKHARTCRLTRNPQYHHPDPRLPHVKTRCPFCPNSSYPMVDMHMHLMDFHLSTLEFDGTGRMTMNMRMVDSTPAAGKEPEVERLRFKYYVPAADVAKLRGYKECYACGLMLPDAGKLQIHLKLHPEFMYFCWLCPRVSSSSLGQVPQIVNHIMKTHFHFRETRPGFVPCPHCNVNMINRPLQHLMYECEHHFVCQLCRDLPSFENAAELREHREKCHYNALRRFECSQCTAYFSTVNDFTAHVCDPTTKKTTCNACKPPVDFKTRHQFLAHFKATHVRGDGVCKICCIKYNNEEQNKHWFGHAKNEDSSEGRTMLLCAYGELNNEMKGLFTHVSNASFRLKGRQDFHGGTEDSPVCLSDDDDIIEVPSTAVQQERRQAAAAAAHVQLHDSSPPAGSHGRPRRTSSALPVASDEAEVLEVMKKILNTVVKQEAEAKADVRSAMEEEEKSEEMPELANVVEDDDDDIMMVDDVPPAIDRTLSARVRVEAEDTTSVGGQNQPGYKEDEDEPMDTPIQPVIREFTPPEDEELCVVAEVENPGCSTAAATISKGRAKKFACPKCSDKFITQARLTNHLEKAHQFDAGQSTIMDELGMPLNTPVWICKSCCLCFQTMEQKNAHNSQHGQQTYRCDTCAGCAYNVEVMNQHHRRIAERKISYVCGECKVEYETDTTLHEHSHQRHGVPLLYFCKMCEMGSTDGVAVYRHFMTGCHMDRNRQRNRSHEDSIKCIGVVPACQLHFQPISLDNYKAAHARNPNGFVVPSICNHRSMIVAVERLVSCNDCKCLDSMQRHLACLPDEAAKQFEASMRPVRGQTPFINFRKIIENEQREQRHEAMARHAPGPSSGLHRYVNGNAPPLPVAARYTMAHQQMPVLTSHLTSHATPRFEEAQRRQNDRMQAVMMARAAGNAAVRSPVTVTPGTAARHFPSGLYPNARGGGGGPTILRSAPLHQHAAARPPMMTRAPLSTMGSLQAIAAVAGVQQGLQQSASSSVVSSLAGSPAGGQCQVCSAPLFSPRDVFLHTLHTPERGAFVCSRCPIAMGDEQAAIKHIVNHMEPRDRATEMDMECPICRKSAPTMSGLRQHLAEHNPPLTHTVQNCSLTFGTAELARAHEDAHKNSGKAGSDCCVLCGTVDNWQMEMVDTRGKGLVINHQMKHACKHVYYCKICDIKQFNEESQMITHFMMSHTQMEGEAWSCNECSEVLATENDHKVHCMAKHTITEMHVPERMCVKVPQTFNDYLGVGRDGQ